MTTQILELVRLWGLRGLIKKLPGEQDLNYLVTTPEKVEYLLKISATSESKSNVDLQTTVLLKLAEEQQSFQFPIPQCSLKGHFIETVHLSMHEKRYVRLFTFVPGILLGDISYHSEGLSASLGRQIACLSQSLGKIVHPNSKRYLKWDLQQAQWIGDQLINIRNDEDRALVERFLRIYETDVRNKLIGMRQQIIHGDLNDYNLLATSDEAGDYQISGMIDFGDMLKSALVAELAIALAYVMMKKSNPLETAVQVVKAYHAVLPLERHELAILFDLICIRLCVSVVNSAIRKRETPDDPYLTVSEQPAWELLRQLDSIDPAEARKLFFRACHLMSDEQIQEKRRQYIGENVGLSYQKPLHFVRGNGQYLYDEHGHQYLDGVNNVSHVGHCHPYVVKAGQDQMARLNTNTRYLHEKLVRYAEKLVSKFPAPLEVCFFVSSGSEANELALRLARTHTKRHKLVVMDHAYHGNTTTLIEISPYKFNGNGGNGKPDFVQVLPMPDLFRQHHLRFENPGFDQSTAAFIAESILSCGGQIELPQGFLKSVYESIRQVGGVCIADEVQIGFGRLGSHFWGFETQGVVPDIVTLGKPIGNGHPIGAVITTREIADSFNNGMEFFSTFGGNPVSCAIGMAVLDVIEQEQLQLRANETGIYLKSRLTRLKAEFPVIGDVRGRGLFLGIEMVTDSCSRNPAPELAEALVNQMKERRVLLSIDGPRHNVIKFKPPMVFNCKDADLLVNELVKSLHSIMNRWSCC